jgi:hypothetical protein
LVQELEGSLQLPKYHRHIQKCELVLTFSLLFV